MRSYAGFARFSRFPKWPGALRRSVGSVGGVRVRGDDDHRSGWRAFRRIERRRQPHGGRIGQNVRAVALLNRGSATASITVQWSALGIPTGAATVRDLWSHTDLGSFSGSYTASSVPSHGVVMVKVTSTP